MEINETLLEENSSHQIIPCNLKEAVLNADLDKVVDRARYKTFTGEDPYAVSNLISELDPDGSPLGFYGMLLYKTALNISHGQRAKKRRVKSKIGAIVEQGACVFLTLTFRDDVLASTTEETRRRYVQRFLKSQCSVYVGNIDFGSTTQREHYHALVFAPRVDMSKWKYGFAWAEVVRGTKADSEKVCKYVTKLSRHALKETAGKGRRIIYSRNT